MRNIPVFTTENGAGSLVLKEIPYSAVAYVKIQDSLEPEKFLMECCDFCKIAGAERIYASGHDYLTKFPLHTAILQMSCLREALPDTDAALFPVTEQTVEKWRALYNRGMSGVDNASYMTFLDAKQMLKRGNGYFIHKEDQMLGIGMAAGERIDAIVSNMPGAGCDVMLALNHALSGERVFLEVASTNQKAIRLYHRLGFIQTGELSRWYKIFEV